MVWFLPVEQLSCCSRELPSAKMTYFDHLLQNCLCFPLEKSVVLPNRAGDIIHPYLTSVSDLTHTLMTTFLDPWRLPSDQKKTWWCWLFFLEYPNTSRCPKSNHKEVCQMPFQNLFSVDFAIWYLIWWLFWGWKICLTHDLPRSNWTLSKQKKKALKQQFWTELKNRFHTLQGLRSTTGSQHGHILVLAQQ